VAEADKGATEEVTNVGEAATVILAEMIAEAASKIAGPEARAEILGNLETKKKITR
jgi:acetaldehyde dehydrogenase (acetylating)